MGESVTTAPDHAEEPGQCAGRVRAGGSCLTATEAARWEANLAASASYLTGLAIGGSVRRIPCGSEQHDIDPTAVPAHAESISIGLLSAWAAPGIDLIERLRIALCGQHGPERARQLMASVPNSYEARQVNGQRRPGRPC